MIGYTSETDSDADDEWADDGATVGIKLESTRIVIVHPSDGEETETVLTGGMACLAGMGDAIERLCEELRGDGIIRAEHPDPVAAERAYGIAGRLAENL